MWMPFWAAMSIRPSAWEASASYSTTIRTIQNTVRSHTTTISPTPTGFRAMACWRNTECPLSGTLCLDRWKGGPLIKSITGFFGDARINFVFSTVIIICLWSSSGMTYWEPTAPLQPIAQMRDFPNSQVISHNFFLNLLLSIRCILSLSLV